VTSKGKGEGAKVAKKVAVTVLNKAFADSKRSTRSRSTAKGQGSEKSATAAQSSSALGFMRSASAPKVSKAAGKSGKDSKALAGSKRLAAKSATKLIEKVAPKAKATAAKAAAGTKKTKGK
jgi:hypothetical protein